MSEEIETVVSHIAYFRTDGGSSKLYTQEYVDDLQKEIERLNNIINELNYGIKELDDMFYETFRISQNSYYSISEWELKEFTDKIKELKGSDKE